MTLSTTLFLIRFRDFTSFWMISSYVFRGQPVPHYTSTSKLRHWLIQPSLWNKCLNQLKSLDLCNVSGTIPKHYSILTLPGHFYQVALLPRTDYHTTRQIAHIYQKFFHKLWCGYNDRSRKTIALWLFLIQSMHVLCLQTPPALCLESSKRYL